MALSTMYSFIETIVCTPVTSELLQLLNLRLLNTCGAHDV